MGEKQFMHLRAPGNWINDPNGFIYYKGMYHMFYQYYPYDIQWGTMHWGHAISEDLLHWEHLGIALWPSVPEDDGGCFSGGAIEDDGKLRLFYTGIHYVEDDSVPLETRRYVSTQFTILSQDGIHFDMKDKKVILPVFEDNMPGDAKDTRDPIVWRGQDAWFMILGSSDKKKNIGKVLLFESQDLEHWKFSDAMEGDMFGQICECPDYFETENGGVMLASPMEILKETDYMRHHATCMLAEFDEKNRKLKADDNFQFLDYGFELYATQTTLDRDGRRIVMAWLRMPASVDNKWNGMHCLPRVVEVIDGHIHFHIHPNVRAAFSKKITDLSMAQEGRCMLRFRLKEGEMAEIGGYTIRLENSCIWANRKNVIELGNMLVTQKEPIREETSTPCIGEECLVEVLLDKNVVEVYLNDGMYTITNAVYGIKNTAVLPDNCELFTTEE